MRRFALGSNGIFGHSRPTLTEFDEIYVYCPGRSTTGGPEALHQLVDALRRLGKNAFISYLPENKRFETAPQYGEYNVEQRPMRDAEGCLAIVPEIIPERAFLLTKTHSAVWWLSVDNYFRSAHYKKWLQERELTARSKFHELLRRDDGLRGLRGSSHLAQSHYAQRFLKRRGLSAPILCGYVNAAYVISDSECISNHRDNVIAYNPKKGMDVTERLMKTTSDVDWIAIDGMTRTNVRQLLRRAKLYVDFGPHPGRDRLPREAAISGACVVTGRQGSAGFPQDMPIPDEWRIDETRPDFLRRFADVTTSILSDHPRHAARLAPYRAAIRGERARFHEQVRHLFAGGQGSHSLDQTV